MYIINVLWRIKKEAVKGDFLGICACGRDGCDCPEDALDGREMFTDPELPAVPPPLDTVHPKKNTMWKEWKGGQANNMEKRFVKLKIFHSINISINSDSLKTHKCTTHGINGTEPNYKTNNRMCIVV